MHKFVLFSFFFLLTITGQAYDLSRVEYFLKEQNLPAAKQALAEQYAHIQTQEEKEQLEFLAAQLFLQEHNYKQAADIYQKILISNPALTRVRLELGYTYFLMKEDEKARYNLRLALAEKDLPQTVRQQILNLLDIIRRRKSWELSVSLGVTPDNNINMVSGRRMECVNFMGVPLCHELDRAESDIGFQGVASLSYIYRLSDSWGIKSRLSIDALDYKDKQYSFWGLGGSIGPRYVTDHGEYGAGITYRQQCNDEHRYNRSPGIYTEMAQDLSDRLFLRGRFDFQHIVYNPSEYQDYNSRNYALNTRLIYTLNDRSYLALSVGFSYDDSRYRWNSYFRQSYGLGYGRELPWGFVIYAEPNIALSHYQDSRYFLNGKGGAELYKRYDVTYGFVISLSSKILQVYNVMPTLNYIYTKRTSNVFNYNYDRSRLEIGLTSTF